MLNYSEISNKIKAKKLEARLSVEKIRTISWVIEPKLNLSIVKEDHDDNKVLECAEESKADYVITNDKHLLKIGSFNGIKIVTPKEFLNMISKTAL